MRDFVRLAFLASLTSSAGLASPADPVPQPAPPPAIAPFDAAAARQHQERWAKHLGVPTEVTNSVGMKLVLIPPGEFEMGSTKEEIDRLARETKGPPDPSFLEHLSAESPRHRVRITRPYWLGACEVTVRQYRRFVEDAHYVTDGEKDGKGAFGNDPSTGQWGQRSEFTWRNPGIAQGDDHPVVAISWNDAVAFCVWLSRKEAKRYRLPTEAEWEYACRSGTESRYCNGDDPEKLSEVGNVADASLAAESPRAKNCIGADDGYPFTSPVRRFKPNAWSLFDMHGNALEWCADRYGSSYYGSCPTDDPAGPPEGDARVLRGGAFASRPSGSAYRHWVSADHRTYGIGFRVVMASEHTAAASNAAATAPTSFRTWTDADRRYHVDAELVSVADGRVRLKKTDGTVIEVPIERLSVADRRYAEEKTGSEGKAGDTAKGKLVLVADGQARCVIVIDSRRTPFSQMAADDLRYHLRRAGGVEIPVVRVAEARSRPESIVRLVIGTGELAASLGISTAGMQPEEYRIETKGNHIFFVGQDLGSPLRWPGDGGSPNSAATLYAVCHFLDRYLGVRWLWPGETGTHVPAQDAIAVPAIHVAARPDLELRCLHNGLENSTYGTEAVRGPDKSLDATRDEAALWLLRHQMGKRAEWGFGHAFIHWWKKHGADHPEYFAQPPAGKRKPGVPPETAKLCVSNPKVADAILEEWVAAKMPDNWNVCPNDGEGFCTCEKCCALDEIGPKNPQDVWAGKTVVTGRYVALWNGLLRRMKEKNPRVTLSSYAYACYARPLPGMRLEDGMVLGLVLGHSKGSADLWKQWQAAGAKVFLRPNWWHAGAVAPHLSLHGFGDFLRFARQNGMVGFYFDSLLGYWATQGPNYYVIARLAARPDLSVDDAVEEYCSAFGSAAPTIKKYVDSWERYTGWLYSPGPGNEPSPYRQLCERIKLHPSGDMRTPWLILPYAYGEEVLVPAESLLKAALMRARQDDPLVQARIRFLQDGLRHLRLTRDVIAGANRNGSQVPADSPALQQAVQRLYKLRDELTPKHVVWGDVATGYMRMIELRPEVRSKRP